MLTGRGGAPGRETNEKREIREISGGDACNVRVGTTRSCTDDQDEDQEDLVRWALVGTKMRTKVVALYRRLRLLRRPRQQSQPHDMLSPGPSGGKESGDGDGGGLRVRRKTKMRPTNPEMDRPDPRRWDSGASWQRAARGKIRARRGAPVSGSA